MARSDFAGMTSLHRWLFLATLVGYAVSGTAVLLGRLWSAVGQWAAASQIVAGLVGGALAGVVGLDVGGTATRFSAHRRTTVGGIQPLDSVTGVRVSHLALFGSVSSLLIVLGALELVL